jgi:hypothetical protein
MHDFKLLQVFTWGAIVTLPVTAALSQDITALQLASQCSTDPTSATGAGATCVAENPSCQTAPDRYVIAQNTIRAKIVTENGPNSQCQGNCSPLFTPDQAVAHADGSL